MFNIWYYFNMSTEKELNEKTSKKMVARNLYSFRTENKHTQKQVAEILGITQQQYSRFERGIYELNYYQIIILSIFYEVTADWILGFYPVGKGHYKRMTAEEKKKLKEENLQYEFNEFLKKEFEKEYKIGK